VLYAVSLVTWFVIVKPANDVLATWIPRPIPQDFEAIRARWETGHMIIAGIKSPDSFHSHLRCCPPSAPELGDRPAEMRSGTYLTPLPAHPRIGELLSPRLIGSKSKASSLRLADLTVRETIFRRSRSFVSRENTRFAIIVFTLSDRGPPRWATD
jgi:hypothetical protein